jgi:hypothetical protein
MTAFTAQIKNFEKLSLRKLTAIVKQSAQDVFSAAQTAQPSVKETGGSFEVGKIPVDWGDLRGSFVSGLNGGTIAQGNEAYVLAIAQAKLGDSIQGGWTMNYAMTIEFGNESGTIKPRAFMRTNAAKWNSFVQANAAKVAAMKR